MDVKLSYASILSDRKVTFLTFPRDNAEAPPPPYSDRLREDGDLAQINQVRIESDKDEPKTAKALVSNRSFFSLFKGTDTPVGNHDLHPLVSILQQQLGQFHWRWEHASKDLRDYCLRLQHSVDQASLSISADASINCFGAVLQALLFALPRPDQIRLAKFYCSQFYNGREVGRGNPLIVIRPFTKQVALFPRIRVRLGRGHVPAGMLRSILPGDILALEYYSGLKPACPAPHFCVVSQQPQRKAKDVLVFSLWEDAGGSLTEVTLRHLLRSNEDTVDIQVLRVHDICK